MAPARDLGHVQGQGAHPFDIRNVRPYGSRIRHLKCKNASAKPDATRIKAQVGTSTSAIENCNLQRRPDFLRQICYVHNMFDARLRQPEIRAIARFAGRWRQTQRAVRWPILAPPNSRSRLPPCGCFLHGAT